MNILANFLTPGIIFLLTLAFGVWLSRSGKPYNGLLFNIHKLIALGTVILTVMRVVAALKGAETQGLVILLLVVAGLCVTALFASGALMSTGKLNYAVMLTIHRIAPALAAAGLAAAVYLFGMNL